jgi:predicted nuclease with RNAse H fold
MIILGIDLSGPVNTADTCLAIFESRGEKLVFRDSRQGAGDSQILEAVTTHAKAGELIIGLDAPLSYQPGGGDRPGDADLRRLVKAKGGGAGVMTPTMTRMAYLTLRGVALTRMLESLRPAVNLRIVEVHPGAVLLLRGASPRDVAGLKPDPEARRRLLDRLEAQGLQNLLRGESIRDHFVAACAAALGAWQWAMGKPAWIARAVPPQHPYDFAC